MSKRLMIPVLVLVGFAVPAMAATTDLGNGWSVTYADDAGLVITPDFGGTGALVIEKVANFTTLDAKVATFTQTSLDALPLIIIADETITNSSGQAWTGFTIALNDVSSGTLSSAVSFDAAASGGFKTNPPFASKSFSADNQTLTISNGILAAGEVWALGQGLDGGELVINALPVTSGATLRSFQLIETPTTVIPLPAALSMGLVGLALVATKKVRGLIA